MRKLPFVCLILAICLLVAWPAPALAQSGSTDADSHVFLTNPVAIAGVGDEIFIADNLESNHSVIFRFDVKNNQPVKTNDELEFADRAIVNIAEFDGKLAVVFKNSIETYTITSTGLTKDQTYANVSALDVTYGALKSNSGDGSTFPAVSYISDGIAKFKGAGDWSEVPFNTPKANAVTFYEGYFYYVYDGQVQRYDGMSNTNDPFNKMDWSHFDPTGIFAYKTGSSTSKLALFDERNAYAVDFTDHTANVSVFADASKIGGSITDVCFAAGKLFVLNSNNHVEIFAEKENSGAFEKLEDVSIGTDTISITPPTEFTGFTLAKSLGYPTNIIYKTTDDANSVGDIVTNCEDSFIILDYEGADTAKYYYVMYGDKFGWVRKSIGATTPTKDAKIDVINNGVGVAGVRYTSKFASLKTVRVFGLPLTGEGEQYLKYKFEQTIANAQEFTFLQWFEEKLPNGSTLTWYYIEFVNPDSGETNRGFIPEGTFGNISNATDMAEGTPCTRQKINSSLFEAVRIYLTESMYSGQEISDKDGNVIKLYSGTHVDAIEKKGLATYVHVYHGGRHVYGWVATSSLIDTNRLTTNAIVGICLLGDAAVLGITLTIVFVERRKRKRRKEQAQPAENIEE